MLGNIHFNVLVLHRLYFMFCVGLLHCEQCCVMIPYVCSMCFYVSFFYAVLTFVAWMFAMLFCGTNQVTESLADVTVMWVTDLIACSNLAYKEVLSVAKILNS